MEKLFSFLFKRIGGSSTYDESDDKEPEPHIGLTPGLNKKHRYFIGKDYSNAYKKDFEMLEKYSEGTI